MTPTSTPKFMDPIKVSKPEIHKKGWGYEMWIANNDRYCGKVLHFNKGARFSFHYHMLKHETWAILDGKVELRTFDLTKAEAIVNVYGKGTVIEVPPGQPHQIIALEETDVFEVSTPHYEQDSYRIAKGDSQK